MALVFTTGRSVLCTFVVVSCCIYGTHSIAQESTDGESVSPIETTLGIELRHDDNIFRSASNKQSSLITMLSPGLLATFLPSRHRFELEYNGEFASYAESGSDDYFDHEFRAGAYLELGARSQLDFIGSYEDAHENRGTGLSQGFGPGTGLLLEEPDEYEKTQFLGKFTFGANSAIGRLAFEAGERTLEYKNDRGRTRFFDREDRYGSATFYLRVMPNTSLLMDVRATEYIYQLDRVMQPSLESAEYRYLLGASWDVTGKSTGTVKVGYVDKIYDDSTRADFSDVSWEVEIRWSPRSYSHFDFATSRYPSEVTSLTGDVIDNTEYSITWSHQWRERLMTRLVTRYEDEEYRGSTGARVQDLFEVGLTLAYEMRHWLSWEFGVGHSAREGNVDRFDFDGNIVRLGANLTF